MDALILGGGASGLMAAAALGLRGARVTLLERQDRVGKKLLATGNGRCNLSNRDMRPALYGDAEAFVSRVFESAPPARVLDFFASLGLLTAEEDSRIYPRTMQAASVLDVLRAACARGNVRMETGREVTSLLPSRRGGFTARTADGSAFTAPAVLAAMGGSAAPTMGTDGSGIQLLCALGHRATPLSPALVQLRCAHPALKSLKGIRAHAELTLLVDGRETARETGELLFADYGVSGVCVFQLSRYAAPACAAGRDVRLVIDLLPELPQDPAWLSSRIDSLPEATCASLLTGALPRLLAQAVLREAGIPADARANALSPAQRDALCGAIRRFPLRVTGTQGFAHAQVTRGGIDRREVDPRTMASRLFDGLYLAGELLDVDGPCGGYNLHFAFASALAASDAILAATRRES